MTAPTLPYDTTPIWHYSPGLQTERMSNSSPETKFELSNLLLSMFASAAATPFDIALRIRDVQQMLEQNQAVIQPQVTTFDWTSAFMLHGNPLDLTALSSKKNEAALQLLQKWLDDDSGYDEATWPTVKRMLEENRSSRRSLFGD